MSNQRSSSMQCPKRTINVLNLFLSTLAISLFKAPVYAFHTPIPTTSPKTKTTSWKSITRNYSTSSLHAATTSSSSSPPYTIQILMSDTGGGHRASANALRDAFDTLHPGKIECDIVDIYTDYGPFWPFNWYVPAYKIMAEYSFLCRPLPPETYLCPFSPAREYSTEAVQIVCQVFDLVNRLCTMHFCWSGGRVMDQSREYKLICVACLRLAFNTCGLFSLYKNREEGGEGGDSLHCYDVRGCTSRSMMLSTPGSVSPLRCEGEG